MTLHLRRQRLLGGGSGARALHERAQNGARSKVNAGPAEILECCDPVAFAIGLVEHEDYLAEMEDES